MIFVTVGHQMAFDRMVRAVDQWAEMQDSVEVFAQIGVTGYRPEHLQYSAHVSPAQFREYVAKADAVVAHAGTGTILTAMELGTPILVMPRRGDLMETRNDHQIMTAERFKALGRVEVAMDEIELVQMLDGLADIKAHETISTDASDELIEAIGDFIHRRKGPIREKD